MKKIDVMILGGGIAGLGAALKAREQGRSAVIFEANSRAGGLLDNFEVEGFRFDNAVHLSFASEPEVRKIFDQTDYYTHPADAWNFEQDKWLRHPVQNNLYPLLANEKVGLIKSFLQRPELEGDDYESWLRHQYGDLIAERYPIRYTQKYWATPAASLSTTWIGNRMRRAELDEILFGTFTSETPNTYYTKEMRYPKKGGFRAFITPLITDSCIKCDYKAVAIDIDSKTVTFSNGEKIQYTTLVSSIPLPKLVEITQSVPSDVEEAAGQLVATSIDLISVGFNKNLVKDLWFYIYDEDILASRAYSPSVKSSDNVPQGCSSLQFEVYSRGTDSSYKKEELIESVIYALEKMDIAKTEDILFTHHKHLAYGNVIFNHGMEIQRNRVRDYFNAEGVKTIGRFGEWDYLWSNQSFLSGYNNI
ncbi:protoporphyrinogen/coproporphyrinogen oxidase [Thalassolituus oleivorans]|uniref:protoporphyrinogen/coproporphyrinogen oxidase n=1 Tax=Thalassolituus oleivorans TaxID=187493 RepID=UPI0023F38B1B|nr:NAD(P)-binding protein [Thalassolituus oleivorans]